MKNYKEKGTAYILILFFSVICFLFYYFIFQTGDAGIKVSIDKQVLDFNAKYYAKVLLEKNDNFCRQGVLIDASNNEVNERTITCLSNDYVNDKRIICLELVSRISLDNQTIPEFPNKEKVVCAEINEKHVVLERKRINLSILLDYSGSMRGSPRQQLINAVTNFIQNQDSFYYSTILFNSRLIDSSVLDRSVIHNRNVISLINATRAEGGTRFYSPVQHAINQLQNKEGNKYILLVSDGKPSDLSETLSLIESDIRSISSVACIRNADACITIISLGIDGANLNALKEVNGNSNIHNADEFLYTASSDRLNEAFQAIVNAIACKIYDVPEDFFNSEYGLFLENNSIPQEDIELDVFNRTINLFGETCNTIVTVNANIIIRWGQPKLLVIE